MQKGEDTLQNELVEVVSLKNLIIKESPQVGANVSNQIPFMEQSVECMLFLYSMMKIDSLHVAFDLNICLCVFLFVCFL